MEVTIKPHGHQFLSGRNILSVKVTWPDGKVTIEKFADVLVKIKNQEIIPTNSTEFILMLGLEYMYGV